MSVSNAELKDTELSVLAGGFARAVPDDSRVNYGIWERNDGNPLAMVLTMTVSNSELKNTELLVLASGSPRAVQEDFRRISARIKWCMQYKVLVFKRFLS